MCIEVSILVCAFVRVCVMYVYALVYECVHVYVCTWLKVCMYGWVHIRGERAGRHLVRASSLVSLPRTKYSRVGRRKGWWTWPLWRPMGHLTIRPPSAASFQARFALCYYIIWSSWFSANDGLSFDYLSIRLWIINSKIKVYQTVWHRKFISHWRFQSSSDVRLLSL